MEELAGERRVAAAMRVVLPLVVCAAIALVGGVGTASATGAVTRSIGGQPVGSPSEAPWSVHIEAGRPGSLVSGGCTGSIVDSTHVLTAAHCTYDEEGIPWAEYEIRAGISRLYPTSAEEQRRQVVGVRRHPDYKAKTFNHDLALLKVEPPFEFGTPTVQPIAVAGVGGGPSPGSTVEFFGWGDVAPETFSIDEHSLRQTALPQWRCGSLGQGLPSFSCRQSATGSPCQGDSGSGVASGNPLVLVGIVGVTGGDCEAGAFGGGTDLTTPEINSWLAGNENPPRAPMAEILPVIVSGARVGEPAECEGERWSGGPTVETAFVEPTAGTIVQRGTSPVLQIPADAAGEQLACVSIASTSGGTTEALSANSIVVGPPRPSLGAAALVTVVRRAHWHGRWRLTIRVGAPEVGRSARLVWTAERCRLCRATRTVTLRPRTLLTSPRFAKGGAWMLAMSLPATESAEATYAAGVKKVRLPRMATRRRRSKHR